MRTKQKEGVILSCNYNKNYYLIIGLKRDNTSSESYNVTYSDQDQDIIKERLAQGKTVSYLTNINELKAPTADDKSKLIILFDFYKALQKKRNGRARDFVINCIEGLIRPVFENLTRNLDIFKHDALEVLEVHTERCRDRKNCGKYEARMK